MVKNLDVVELINFLSMVKNEQRIYSLFDGDSRTVFWRYRLRKDRDSVCGEEVELLGP